MRKAPLVLPFLALATLGSTCSPGDFKVVLDDTAISLEDTGSYADLTGFNGAIEGTVRVILYSVDVNGDYVYQDWSVHNGEWPFGSIWVFAFETDDETGRETYYQNVPMLNPSPEGDDYRMEIRTADTEALNIGAQLDFGGDGVMGTWDPIGIYPDSISVMDGSTVAGVDIAILAYWNPHDGSGWGWGYGHGGGGGGAACPYLCDEGGGNDDGSTTVSGDVVLTYAYAGGEAVAMVMSPDGQGPYYSQGVTPVPAGGGAEAPYSITGWAGLGEMAVTGCHDSNYNQLIEADDKCGAFTSEVGVDGNPLDFSGDANFEGDIEIPMGDYGFDLVPFVQLNGTISIQDETFDDLPSGSTLYVAALKFQPSLEITAQDLMDRAYDFQSWTTSELTGQSSIEYAIPVPANTIVYLMAYVDEDGDGQLNETGEHVAAGDSETGRIPTGSTSQEVHLVLNAFEESAE